MIEVEAALCLVGQDLTECCKNIIPGQTDEVLLKQLQALVPGHTVRLALAGEEWYKLGGVVDMAGNRIAKDITEWAERTFIECGQNLQTLIAYALEQNLIATKRTGKTLYFVVQTGNSAEDFTLIEIDKIHEVSDRMLINEAHPPEDVEDLIDPLHPLCIESFSLGHSRYIYRRKTDVRLFMEVINERYQVNQGKHPVQRFMDDWNRSSAGQKAAMSTDWIIRPYRHTGRYGEQIVNVEIVNIHANNLPHMEDFTGKKGDTLSNLLTRFDRQAGYPFAWFFYMLKGRNVAPHCAEGVYRDISNDYAYLPKRDMEVIKEWVKQPYNL